MDSLLPSNFSELNLYAQEAISAAVEKFRWEMSLISKVNELLPSNFSELNDRDQATIWLRVNEFRRGEERSRKNEEIERGNLTRAIENVLRAAEMVAPPK
jgi:hypothetical protein